ncbi:MAG TPA: DUF362 domain-containing protein [Terriglobales bacterium]|nr:DUF362 domain-containing protein [Terriglobales bacterium]
MFWNADTSRRDFLKTCLTGAAILRASGKLPRLEATEPGTVAGKSRVVIARDAMLHGRGASVDSGRVQNMLDRSMQALLDGDNPTEAWKRLVRPQQKIGLKVNVLGGRGLSSNLPLVEAVCERLQEAGIRASDIVIWDRDSDELEHAGFHVSTAGNRVQCFGTDRVGYEEELVSYGKVASRLSRILTRSCDLLINVPVLKDHDGAGITAALKNMYGAIHNPNKFHLNACNPYIADVNMLPMIRTKMCLTICDATTAAYEGGPGYKPQYDWRYNALIVSQDPVALDYIGWQIIEHKRAEKGLETLEANRRAPRYIATAADAQHRLGTDDPKKIAVVEV